MLITMPWKDPQKIIDYRKNNRQHLRQLEIEWASRNPEKMKLKWTLKTLRKRHRILEIVGRGLFRCVSCGCNRIEFLEVNHRNGGGTQENARPSKFYGDILAGRREIDDLELRCKLCNALHYLEYKYGQTGFMISYQPAYPAPVP